MLGSKMPNHHSINMVVNKQMLFMQ